MSKRKTKTTRKPRHRPAPPPLTGREVRQLARFARVCTYIYGARWQVDLSRALSLNERTVRAYIQGRSKIPSAVLYEVKRLLDHKLSRAKDVQAIMARCIENLPAEE